MTVNKNNAFANVAMEAAYREGGPWLDLVLAYLESNVELVDDRVARMAGVDFVKPEGTFLVWLDFRASGVPADDLATFLRYQAKWSVTRGSSFGEGGSGFVRVNIGCTHARLEKAFGQLANALESVPP